MSIQEIIAELPKLSREERHLLIERAYELEDDDLSPEEHAILDERMEAHRLNPDAGIDGELFFANLRSRLDIK